MKVSFRDDTFRKINYSDVPLVIAEYDGCVFENCDFSNCDLSHIEFAECEFKACNWSTAKLHNVAFRDVQFKDCKMLGLHFGDCNEFLFEVYFEGCMLNLSSFYKLKMKNTQFKNCSMQEVYVAETDLTASVFDNCDFTKARFEGAVLEKADFRTAYNYTIDPEMNRIKKAKFSLSGLPGLLDRYNIIVQ